MIEDEDSDNDDEDGINDIDEHNMLLKSNRNISKHVIVAVMQNKSEAHFYMMKFDKPGIKTDVIELISSFYSFPGTNALCQPGTKFMSVM